MNNGHNSYHSSSNNFVTPPHSSHSRYGYNDIGPLSSSSVSPSNPHSYPYPHQQHSSSASIDKEWERLEVEKKRLELQQQHLALEKEELKADRRKFKKIVKASNNRLLPVDEREAATSRQMVIELEQQVEHLQQQMKQQQQQQQQQQQNTTTKTTNDDNRKDLEQELQSCREDLQKTQTSLAALFVERDSMRTDKERAEERLKDVEAQLVEQDESRKKTTDDDTDVNEEQNEELDQLRLKVISLEANLQSMKTAYANLTVTHTEEKRQWKELQQQQQQEQQVTSSATLEEISRQNDLLKKYEEENEALRRTNTELQSTIPPSTTAEEELKSTHQDREELDNQWKDERQKLQREMEALKVQVRHQTKQIDDWKLLVPKNKMMLEQTQAKNDQLTSQLETARTKETEQSQLIETLQTELQELQQKNGQLQHYTAQQIASNENNTMINDDDGDDDDDVVSADDSVDMEDIDLMMTTSPSQSSGPLPIVIPSDLTSSELAVWNSEKKHVIEWEWEPRRHQKQRGEAEEDGNRILGGIYTGWLNLEGNPEGYGTLRIVDGSIYTGSWRNGRKNGFGVYTSIDGALFSGPWMEDTYHGRGVYVSELNQVYTGDWKQGKRDGSGIETWEDGARYVGRYKDDGRSGYGSYVYPDGRRFEGNFLDDRPDRHGTQALKSDGSWSKGDFVGS